MDLAIHEATSRATANPIALIIQEETALVSGLIENDRAAWRTFSTRYRPLVVRTITTITRRFAAPAEDVQDIYGRLMCGLVANDKRRLRAFDPSRARLGGYLAMLAEHAAYDHVRAERRHGLTGARDGGDKEVAASFDRDGEDGHDPFTICLQRERMAAVRQLAARQLTPAEQEFFAAYMSGMSPEEIAEKLKIRCMKTVYTRKHKVLAKIAAIVAST